MGVIQVYEDRVEKGEDRRMDGIEGFVLRHCVHSKLDIV
jgi:hypothetical protein